MISRGIKSHGYRRRPKRGDLSTVPRGLPLTNRSFFDVLNSWTVKTLSRNRGTSIVAFSCESLASRHSGGRTTFRGPMPAKYRLRPWERSLVFLPDAGSATLLLFLRQSIPSMPLSGWRFGICLLHSQPSRERWLKRSPNLSSREDIQLSLSLRLSPIHLA